MPAAARHAGEDRRRHRRGGHGIPGPAAGGCDGAAAGASCRPDPSPWSWNRRRSAPAPTTWKPPTRSSWPPPGPRPPTAVRRRLTCPRPRRSSADELEAGELHVPGRHPHRMRWPTTVSWWSITSLSPDDETVPDIDSDPHQRARTARLPGRRGGDDGVHRLRAHQGRLARRRGHRRPRPGPAPGRAVPRRRHSRRTASNPLDDEPLPGIIEITTASAGRGFVSRLPEARACSPRRTCWAAPAPTPPATCASGCRQAAQRRGPAAACTEGDFVVHEQHGVGQVRGADRPQGRRRRAEQPVREYLVLEYAPAKRGAPGDRLFVPTDQLDQVTRYVGGEAPALSKMGGSDWAKHQVQGAQGGQGDRRRI